MDSFDQMEEERRLCYVGMTRAKEKLFLDECRLKECFRRDEVPDQLKVCRRDRPRFSGFNNAVERRPEALVGGHPDEPYYTIDESQLDGFDSNESVCGAGLSRISLRAPHLRIF